ncbi:pseudouridine synthase [Bombardia bombarda]|uniref:tRNA pseudouridine(55) synthase n=1 Tax=Bombardia bombarda TaxID=252184 RepID=A0AA40CF47_9PEZI|nr:pseudouridine synthase [Bombardia bombarda]
MAKDNIVEGVFAINKPIGMSSAQVIRDCQNYFNPSALFAPLLDQEKTARDKESQYQQKRRSRVKRDLKVKMGHGGTLDPLATGVLILGVGKGTKSLQQFLNCTKTYETVCLFGASTDTYDRVGRIIKKGNYDDVTRPAVEKALEKFRGKFKQMPPLYSALKMEGKPLYEYAREGKPIPRDIATRDVDVTELEIVEWYEPGTHNHRWPTDEAGQAEKSLVDSVWKVAKQQTDGEEPKTLTAEEQDSEAKAAAEFTNKKREAEDRVDGLVQDQQSSKRRKTDRNSNNRNDGGAEPMMSGALGDLPAVAPAGRGSNLIPPPPSADTPPPWEGKGPPAVRIRMTVTSGFYVRSLCHDLGEAVGSGAMMAELSRSRQGQFVLGSNNCLEYTDLAKGENVWGPKVESMLNLWTNGASATPNGKTEAPAVAEPKVEVKVEEKVEEMIEPKVEEKVEEEVDGEVPALTATPVESEKKSEDTAPAAGTQEPATSTDEKVVESAEKVAAST